MSEKCVHMKMRGIEFYSELNDGVAEYYKNGSKLVNPSFENSQPIDENEFKVLLRNEIYNFMYPFDSIVVLAGAGASIITDENGKPDLNYGHTIVMLADIINTLLEDNPRLFKIDELCKLCKYSEQVKINKEINQKFNLEDFLSKVIAFEEFYSGKSKSKYKETKNEILKIIKKKTSYNFDEEKHKHGGLIKLLSSLHKSPNRLTVVTTNYDTLFEEAASHLNFTAFDGFSFDDKSTFDVDLFDWSLAKPILNVNSDKLEYKKNCINLLKIHGSLSWKRNKNDIVKVSKSNNDEPIMIFPSANKYSHSYEKPYFELFTKFQELIKKPNTLFITTGFSFFDNHIAKMITQAVKSSPSLSMLITNYSIEENNLNENIRELNALMNDGYRILFLKSSLNNELLDYFSGIKNDNR